VRSLPSLTQREEEAKIAKTNSDSGSESRMILPTPTHKLSPSDFAFLWLECKRCFYLKVVRGFGRPRTGFPGIFSVIDSRMKDCFEGERTENMVADLPPGAVAFGEKWVQSAPIEFPGRESSCYIRGKFDTIIRFDDDTYGVVDFKTSAPKKTTTFIYSRQLHAYAYALENAAPDKFALSPVSKLGLLVYQPDEFANHGAGRASLKGSLTWWEIERDDAAFMKFLSDVHRVLELPEPPEPSEKCTFCQYRDASRENGL
jgi:hypothetical protein